MSVKEKGHASQQPDLVESAFDGAIYAYGYDLVSTKPEAAAWQEPRRLTLVFKTEASALAAWRLFEGRDVNAALTNLEVVARTSIAMGLAVAVAVGIDSLACLRVGLHRSWPPELKRLCSTELVAVRVKKGGSR